MERRTRDFDAGGTGYRVNVRILEKLFTTKAAGRP
jgi:hypothetical protein